MDLIIVIFLIFVILIWKRDLVSFAYFLGITEIFFRIMHFIGNNIHIKEISNVINKYIPSSLISILDKYSDGLFYTILSWGLCICFIILEVYLIKYWFKRK